jgi:thiol-disulfide isomerase/thioredoxin
MGKISTRIYLKAALLTIAVFITGVAIGWYLDETRVYFVKSKIDELEISFSNLALEEEFYRSVATDSKTLCNIYISKANELALQAGKLGSYLESFREISKFGLHNIESLKDKYFILNLQLWLYMRKLREECNYNVTTILLFYTSVKKCDDCIAQGIVLDQLKKKDPNKYMIFAIDADSKLGIVNALKVYFNVTQVPTLIINEKRKLEGFVSKQELEEITK